MTIEQEERARIRAILGCASAKKMPKLADILAIESEFTAEQAVTMLDVAAAEIDSAVAAAAKPSAAAWRKNEPKAGVGIGTPEPIGGAPAAEGWHRAVANVNRHIGDDAADGKADAGWKRAVGAAGR
ncbi:hypothetical protein [Mesorhizobium sp. M0207]|uniref:hypothetical protein n=1 Tax=Mesorhizobium sp. M0207 TaxID=2956915 RepID=UPI00333812C6